MQVAPQDIVLITAGIAVAVLLLLTFFFMIAIRYFNVNRRRQKEIFVAVLNAQEKERKRIANDLHDQIVPMLSAIKLNVGMLTRKQDTESLKEAIEELKEYLDTSIMDIRRISHNLVPKRIAELGLAGAIENYISYIKKSENVGIIFTNNLHFLSFDEVAESNLYRIVQELINNSLVHGKATLINIEMKIHRKEFYIYTTDNGVGFNSSDNRSGGMGAASITSRVELFGGRCEWESSTGKGTRFKALFNLTNFA